MKKHSSKTGEQPQTRTKQTKQPNTKEATSNSKSIPAKNWPLLLAKIQGLLESDQVVMIGIDTGDRVSELCVLSPDKQVLVRGGVLTDRQHIQDLFGQLKPTTVVMETGTHSPWMDRVLRECGHRVLVASAREVSRVLKNKKKNDRRDAEQLARLAAADEKLLGLVEHRSEQAQLSLGKVKVRHQLVKVRTQLCNAARGLVKSHGYRLPKMHPEGMNKLVAGALPEQIGRLIAPLLKVIEDVNESIRKVDKELAELAAKEYPETNKLEQIYGVGPIVALAFVLTIDDPVRFKRSRDVGSYLGLVPAQDQSGDMNPQLRITKEGDGLMRSLLVNAAQCVMWENSPECDLKRHGMKLAGKGDRIARKKAVVGVARKLAVLMHKLLVSKGAYNPQHNEQQRMKEQKVNKGQAKAAA